jgi:hypothetical protein
MLPYLLPGCPWTPRYRDGEVEVADRVPRGGKRALGVEIPTEISSISVSTRHVCDHCFSRKCDGVLSEAVDYLNSHTDRRWSISHFSVGTMVSGESLKSAKILDEHRARGWLIRPLLTKPKTRQYTAKIHIYILTCSPAI